MAQRSRYPGEESPEKFHSSCSSCASPDPQYRSQHFLGMVKHGSLDILRAHITHEFVTMREPEAKRQDAVDSICAWAAHLMEMYGTREYVDENTGEILNWHQLRDVMTRRKEIMAETCYKEAPAAYRLRNPLPGVAGFVRPVLTQEEPANDVEPLREEDPEAAWPGWEEEAMPDEDPFVDIDD